MTDIASAFAYTGFVLVGIWLAIATNKVVDGVRRRRIASVLILYVCVLSFGAGLFRRNAWPFSSWPIMTTPAPRQMDSYRMRFRILGVTEAGVEYRIDWRAWQPWSYQELVFWIARRVPELSDEAAEGAGRHLLGLANNGREAVRSGRRPGTWSRPLGPLTSPPNYLRSSIWSNPEDVPVDPFVKILVYEEHFDLELRRADPSQITLVLAFEYDSR